MLKGWPAAADRGLVLPFLLACRVVEDPDAGVCPSWSGLVGTGQVWSWERFADEHTWMASLDVFEAENVEVVQADGVSTYRCDAEGAWATGRWQGTAETWSEWTFEPPYLVVPRVLEVGTAWSSDIAWNLQRSDGTQETASTSAQFIVEAEVQTVVPAGSFDTLQVRVLDAEGGDSWYFARDVGVVLTDSDQLVGFNEN